MRNKVEMVGLSAQKCDPRTLTVMAWRNGELSCEKESEQDDIVAVLTGSKGPRDNRQYFVFRDENSVLLRSISLVLGLHDALFTVSEDGCFPLDSWSADSLAKLPAFLADCSQMAPNEAAQLLKYVEQTETDHREQCSVSTSSDRDKHLQIAAQLEKARGEILRRSPKKIQPMDF